MYEVVDMTDEENAIRSLEANLKNLRSEFESYPDKLKHNEKLLDRINRQIDTRDKFHDVVMKGLFRIEPVFKYEEDDEYWDLNRKLQTLQFESEKDKMLHEQRTIKHAIKDINTELTRLTKELPIKEKELKEMKGE